MLFSELSVFPCRFHSTGVPLIVKIGKKLFILIIFIGVAQKALRLWCEGPSSKKEKPVHDVSLSAYLHEIISIFYLAYISSFKRKLHDT
jgi:hypothetical protein